MTKNKWIAVSAGVVLIGAGIGYKIFSDRSENGPTYQKVTVQKGRLDVKILSSGTVAPENRVEIKPPISGRIEQVLVEEGQKVKKGQIIAWMSSSERAALLDAATARGKAELKEWGELYKPTPVLAPINGMVIQRKVESGQTLTAADPIISMSDRLSVKAQVDETDIAQIKLKQKVTIVLDAYATQTIDAHVDQIAYDAKPVNNVTNYVVDVIPDQVLDYMRSGMTANVTFDVASKPDALYVPVDAIKVTEGKPSVLVPNEKDTSNPISKEVQTGLSDGKKMEILSGLAEGETILVPEFKLDSKKQNANPFSPMGSGRSRR